MNELKPVAVTTEEQVDLMMKNEVALMYAPSLFEGDDVKLYAIPDTHRVVSVELLLDALGWVDDLSTFTDLRAIIDNKGEKDA